MTIDVKNRRKDGKFSVVLGFNNGVRLNKILTADEIKKLQDHEKEIKQNAIN